MSICKTCGTEVTIDDNKNNNNRRIGIEYKGEIHCVPCHEVLIFLGEETVNKRESPKEKVKLTSRYECIKCKKELSMSCKRCEECDWAHPLLNRQNKKGKRR